MGERRVGVYWEPMDYEIRHDGVLYLLQPDDEAGGYVASVPSLPGCFSQGETLDDALGGIREAMLLHIECLAEVGDPIPDEFVRFIPERVA